MLCKESDIKLHAYRLQLCKNKNCACDCAKMREYAKWRVLGSMDDAFYLLQSSWGGFCILVSIVTCERDPKDYHQHSSTNKEGLWRKAGTWLLGGCRDLEGLGEVQLHLLEVWRGSKYQFSSHVSRLACRETGDLPATWEKLASLNSSAGTSASEEGQSCTAAVRVTFPEHSNLLPYQKATQQMLKWLFWFWPRHGIFQTWSVQR